MYQHKAMNFQNYKFKPSHQLLLLLLLAVGLNINTLFNDYALDDCVVLTENNLVQQGFKGIPQLLSTDYVYGYSTQQNILNGARYRPLSLIFFAVEYQFFGANPFISHLISILLFALLTLLLYRLLHQYLFRNQRPMLAFVTCLLFAVHPIHTEVIANVKSRDEIIAFIFIILSAISMVKYIEQKAKLTGFISLLCYLLALLTKETAVTYIGIVPLLIYFFLKADLKVALLYTIPYFVVFIGYLALRYRAVGFHSYPVDDVTNAPYLHATATEAFASKVYILFRYIALLFIPHPLSTDYGYNQLPYIQLFSAKFLLSFMLIVGLVLDALYNFKKRSLLSFAALYFFVTISVATNFIIDLGAPLAERMLFQPSLAYCMVIAFLVVKTKRTDKRIAYGLLSLTVVLFSVKTVARNFDWKNNETIIIADVANAPECSRLNLYACERYIIKANQGTNTELKNEYLDKAIAYGEKSLRIHPKFAYVYQRLGFAYFNKQNYDKAANLWQEAAKRDTANLQTKQWLDNLSLIIYNQGNEFLEKKNTVEAVKRYQKSITINSKNAEAYYKLGGCYFLLNDSVKAMQYWDKVKEIDPDFPLQKQDFYHK